MRELITKTILRSGLVVELTTHETSHGWALMIIQIIKLQTLIVKTNRVL